MLMLTRRFSLSLLALSAMTFGVAVAVAQSPQSGARVESFRLDPVHCMALFRLHHQGAGQFWGRFNEVTGTVDYPRDDSKGPVFDVAVAVDSIDTGTTKLDRTLMGPDFFNGVEFNSITFKSTGAERIGEGRWKMNGDLTILGKTLPVTAEVEVTGVRGNPVVAKAGWEAIFTIKRSDYGMTWGVENGSLGDEVRLVVGLEGESGPPARR
ncbi:MAG: YceI family protein [Phycisphaerales bacterium]|nr:YceI family protein [Phycisphaerales bacterium]